MIVPSNSRYPPSSEASHVAAPFLRRLWFATIAAGPFLPWLRAAICPAGSPHRALAAHPDTIPAPGLGSALIGLIVGWRVVAGSHTSSSPGFVAAVGPAAAVYSAGRGNSYGHPHDETIRTLCAAHVAIYGTDVDGTVVIVSDGAVYSIATERTRRQPDLCP
jgi:hypothetical protein